MTSSRSLRGYFGYLLTKPSFLVTHMGFLV